MDGMPLKFSFRFLLPAAILLLSACGPVASQKQTVAGPGNSTGGGSTTPVSGGEVVNSAGFFIAGTGSPTTNIVAYMHQADAPYGSDVSTTNFSSSCKVDYGSADGNDLFCIAEVNELDLYFNNFQLQYHVPSNMCTYFRIKPYWFYAFEPGNGPTSASHEVLETGAIRDVTNTSAGTPVCQYDYTTSGGPNCCFGTYTHLITTYSSTGFTQNSTVKTWTGKAGNCATGPALNLSGFSTEASTGLPLDNIYDVQSSGLNDSLSITAPINAIFNGNKMNQNLFTANFYNPSDHTGGLPITMQEQPGITSTLSKFIPQDTYEFQCLDAAEDLKQRIRLMIREWNTVDQLATGEGADPDVTGFEPGFASQPYNDRGDWKDFTDFYPVSIL